MSRNYELLLRAEKERKARVRAVPEVSFAEGEPITGLTGGIGIGVVKSLKAECPVVDCVHPLDAVSGVEREELAGLVDRVFMMSLRTENRAVVFSAPEDGENAGRVAALAGEILAPRVQGSVCVVDMNFVHPTAQQLFSLPHRPGFSDALLDKSEPALSFTNRISQNLWVLCCGYEGLAESGRSNADAVQCRVRELRKSFDYLLIAAANISASTQAIMAARCCDGVVLILEAGSTRRTVGERCKQALADADVLLIGAVLRNREYPIPEAIYKKL